MHVCGLHRLWGRAETARKHLDSIGVEEAMCNRISNLMMVDKFYSLTNGCVKPFITVGNISQTALPLTSCAVLVEEALKA